MEYLERPDLLEEVFFLIELRIDFSHDFLILLHVCGDLKKLSVKLRKRRWSRFIRVLST